MHCEQQRPCSDTRRFFTMVARAVRRLRHCARATVGDRRAQPCALRLWRKELHPVHDRDRDRAVRRRAQGLGRARHAGNRAQPRQPPGRVGLGRKAAAAKLARSSNAAKLAGAKAKTSSLQTTILGWRKGLLERRVKNFEGRELLLAGREKIRDLPKHDPRLVEFAERQLAELAELCGVLSPHS
jgi:hypothetical protein